jgi:hypothetical protein
VFCLDDRMADDADELFVQWDGEENPERFTFSEYQFDKDGKSALIFIEDETLPKDKPRRLGSSQSGQSVLPDCFLALLFSANIYASCCVFLSNLQT